jgi:hypothetical protein
MKVGDKLICLTDENRFDFKFTIGKIYTIDSSVLDSYSFVMMGIVFIISILTHT